MLKNPDTRPYVSDSELDYSSSSQEEQEEEGAVVSALMIHCRVKPLSSAKSSVSSKRANTGAAAQPKKLDFPRPCTVASVKKAKMILPQHSLRHRQNN